MHFNDLAASMVKTTVFDTVCFYKRLVDAWALTLTEEDTKLKEVDSDGRFKNLKPAVFQKWVDVRLRASGQFIKEPYKNEKGKRVIDKKSTQSPRLAILSCLGIDLTTKAIEYVENLANENVSI